MSDDPTPTPTPSVAPKDYSQLQSALQAPDLSTALAAKSNDAVASWLGVDASVFSQSS